MFSSTHQRIVCVVIIITSAVLAQAQSAPVKEATSTISGKVTLKDKPLAGVVISVSSNQSSSGDRPINFKGTSDANGEYRITNVPAGNYIILPLAPAFVTVEDATQQRPLIVNKGETIEHIDFSLIRGGAITGKIVDADGRPVIEQEVLIFGALGSNRMHLSRMSALTDDRGIYRVFGLRAGSYKVGAGQANDVHFGGYNRSAFFERMYYPAVSDIDQAEVIELSEGGEATNIDITLGRREPTYSASGRVVDAETGQPLANVPYGVMRFLTPDNRSSMFTGVVSNSRGEFKLENLVPGKYAVQVRNEFDNANPNWRAEDLPFEIVDGDVTGLVVQTRKGAMVSGVIVLDNGEDKSARDELRRTMVSVILQRDGNYSSSGSMVRADGTFSIAGVGSGTASFQLGNSRRFRILRVERNGVADGSGVEIKEGETISGLRIVVAYGNASIHGAIEVASGTLPPNVHFYAWVRNIADDLRMAAGTAGDVDARGQFVIDGLMPGTYEINAGIISQETGRTLGSKRQQVVVTAGSVNNVTLSVEVNPNPTKP